MKLVVTKELMDSEMFHMCVNRAFEEFNDNSTVTVAMTFNGFEIPLTREDDQATAWTKYQKFFKKG